MHLLAVFSAASVFCDGSEYSRPQSWRLSLPKQSSRCSFKFVFGFVVEAHMAVLDAFSLCWSLRP